MKSGVGGGRRFLGPPANNAQRKDREDDLALFREMFRREKESTVSLLLPVSDEFESNSGSHPLYKIPSGKKGLGHDFLAAESGKNDYDWLKTPPATPLFPSLEMEATHANDPNIVVQKEIPILRPLKPSRFAGKVEESKPCRHRQKSPIPSSTSSSRSVTSTMRNNFPLTAPKATNLKGTAIPSNEKSNQTISDLGRRPMNSAASTSNKPANPKGLKLANSTASIPSKTQTADSSKPRSRAASPLVRSRIPATIPAGFPDEAPPNLITTPPAAISSRASSATRGRPPANNTLVPTVESTKLGPAGMRPRRQSCSPSVTRGRKAELRPDGDRDVAPTKGRTTQVGNLVVGSRMVEKVMNARRSAAAAAGRNEKANPQQNTGHSKSSTPTISSTQSPASSTTPRTTPGHESKEERNPLKKGEGRARYGMCLIRDCWE